MKNVYAFFFNFWWSKWTKRHGIFWKFQNRVYKVSKAFLKVPEVNHKAGQIIFQNRPDRLVCIFKKEPCIANNISAILNNICFKLTIWIKVLITFFLNTDLIFWNQSQRNFLELDIKYVLKILCFLHFFKYTSI